MVYVLYCNAELPFFLLRETIKETLNFMVRDIEEALLMLLVINKEYMTNNMV